MLLLKNEELFEENQQIMKKYKEIEINSKNIHEENVRLMKVHDKFRNLIERLKQDINGLNSRLSTEKRNHDTLKEIYESQKDLLQKVQTENISLTNFKTAIVDKFDPHSQSIVAIYSNDSIPLKEKMESLYLYALKFNGQKNEYTRSYNTMQDTYRDLELKLIKRDREIGELTSKLESEREIRKLYEKSSGNYKYKYEEIMERVEKVEKSMINEDSRTISKVNDHLNVSEHIDLPKSSGRVIRTIVGKKPRRGQNNEMRIKALDDFFVQKR